MARAEVGVALGIPDQVTLAEDGNAELLAAIRRKDARIAELEKVVATIFDKAKDLGQSNK